MTAATLHTTFALDRLTQLAEHLSSTQFHSLLAPVFGDDLPATCYQRLHDALRNGTVRNPSHRIAPELPSKACYDNLTRCIHLHPQLIADARQAPQMSCELATVLLHEFGHHLDNLLRHDYAPLREQGTTLAEDAALEEGARFAHLFSSAAHSQPGLHWVARLVEGQRSLSFEVEGQALQVYLSQHQGEQAQRIEAATGSREGFSAGRGDKNRPELSWGHESIEEDLKLAGFNAQQRHAIYFGNWLRDYSQLLDPKLVRAIDAPKDFPAKLSREVLTQLVDLLALRAFPKLQETPQGRSEYTVTPQMLGVYRPSEHIDNPFNPSPAASDPRRIDPDFEAPVGKDDALLQVDAKTSMKRYISTSVEFMCERLGVAMAEGPTAKGLREFGAALHVLEDYFAHSNYAELALRQQGHDTVLTWTAQADCTHGWPVVTGMFGGSDVIASLAEPMAKVLFPVSAGFKEITPGQRADEELALLILLRDHPDPKWQEYLKTSLEVRDTLADIPGFNGVRLVSWILGSPLRGVADLTKLGYQAILNLAGNTVDDIQTLTQGNPMLTGSTHPTHSQLAKDHDVHPLHTLATLMARVAVREVGFALYKYWEGGRLRDPVKVARAFFTHPNDSDWQHELVRKWASEHPDNIRQASDASVFEKLQIPHTPTVDKSVWERLAGLFD